MFTVVVFNKLRHKQILVVAIWGFVELVLVFSFTWYDPSAFFMLETRNTSTGTRRAETIVIHRQRDIMTFVNPLLSFSRTDRSQSTKSQENIKLPIRHMANTDHPMAKWAVRGIFSYLETLLNPMFWRFYNCGLDFWHFFLLFFLNHLFWSVLARKYLIRKLFDKKCPHCCVKDNKW